MGNIPTRNGKPSRLTFVRELGERTAKHKRIQWECICDCGNTHIAVKTDVLSGKIRSCGCLNRDYMARRKDAIDVERNSQRDKAYNQTIKDRGRAFIDGYRMSPCIDCGNCFPPECMDFDHLDPTNKRTEISRLVNYNLETIWAEIQKCELICANCHRIRTAKTMRDKWGTKWRHLIDK